MSTTRKNFMIRGVLLIISLVLIIFTGREKNEDGVNKLAFSDHGRESFRLGMDVAGGTRLTYKIDYGKYKDQYPDQFAFNQAKQDAETVILQQVDSRISKLGVSDYTAKPVTLDNEHYMQIELGGVQDIEEAKAIIGKTVELEFKLANDAEPTTAEYDARKQRATNWLTEVTKNPSLFNSIAANHQSDGIVFTQWPSSPLGQLPSIYQELDFSTMKTGAIYPTLLEGMYQDFSPEQEAQGYADLEGFTLVKLVDVTSQSNGVVTAQQLSQYAADNALTLTNTITADQPTTEVNTLSHNQENQQIVYNGGEVLIGEVGYDVTLYEGTGTNAELTQKAQAGNATELVGYEGWLTEANVLQFVPTFSYEEGKEWYESAVTGSAVVLNITEQKPVDQSRYAVLSIDNVNPAQYSVIKDNLENQVLYTLEEIFVNQRSSWLTAVDPKTGDPLDAKHFEIARVSADQLGNQVASITFNEEGQRIFCNLTEKNVGNQMAIFVGGTLVSAPVIQDKICGGETIINGDFTGQTCYNKDGSTYTALTHREGTQCMVENLNEGALPAPLILTQEEKVSASLGQKSLNGVIIAGIVGFIAIFLYMFFLYGVRKAAVSLIVLISFMVFLMAILKLMGYVISLSSLAALILTIGMSVDACILMFERINEELKVQTLESAIIDGCKRSRPAIRDGNLSTGLIALLLFMMGVNVFKGFGSMMIITILIILFMIVPLTKMLLLMIEKKQK